MTLLSDRLSDSSTIVSIFSSGSSMSTVIMAYSPDFSALGMGIISAAQVTLTLPPIPSASNCSPDRIKYTQSPNTGLRSSLLISPWFVEKQMIVSQIRTIFSVVAATSTADATLSI